MAGHTTMSCPGGNERRDISVSDRKEPEWVKADMMLSSFGGKDSHKVYRQKAAFRGFLFGSQPHCQGGERTDL